MPVPEQLLSRSLRRNEMEEMCDSRSADEAGVWEQKGSFKMELRKINLYDAAAQWEYTTALPADENGLINP